jgi:hypothetical protein
MATNGVLQIKFGESLVSSASVRLLEDLTVNGLRYTGSSDKRSSTLVTVVTDARNSASSLGVHGIAVILAIAIAMIYFGLLLQGTRALRRDWRPIRLETKFSYRINPRYLVPMLFVIVITGFLAPPFYDDGWVLSRARLLADGWHMTKANIDPYNFGIANPQGFIYESLLGLTVAQQSWIPLLRLFSIGFCMGVWLILIRISIRITNLPRGTAIAIVTALMIVAATLWFGTIREEVLVSFLLALVMLTIAAGSRQSHASLYIFVFLILGALALASQQSGLAVVLAAILPIVLWARVEWYQRPGKLLASLSAGFGAGLAIVFMNQSATQALREIGLYRELQDASSFPKGPLYEFARAQHLQALDSDLFNLWGFFTYGIIFIAAFVLPSSALDRRGRLLALACLSAALGLAVTDTKWIWHSAVLVVPSVILLLLVVDKISSSFFAESKARTTPLRDSNHVRRRLLMAAGLWFFVASLAYLSPYLDGQFTSLPVMGFAASVIWIAVLCGGLLALLIGAVGEGDPRTALCVGPKESSIARMFASLTVLVSLAVAGLILANPPRATDDQIPTRSFAKQTFAGLTSSYFRCNSLAVNRDLSSVNYPALLEGESLFPPTLALYVPCLKNPSQEGGVWRNPSTAVGSLFGSQSLFAGLTVRCPPEKMTGIWRCREVAPSVE